MMPWLTFKISVRKRLTRLPPGRSVSTIRHWEKATPMLIDAIEEYVWGYLIFELQFQTWFVAKFLNCCTCSRPFRRKWWTKTRTKLSTQSICKHPPRRCCIYIISFLAADKSFCFGGRSAADTRQEIRPLRSLTIDPPVPTPEKSFQPTSHIHSYRTFTEKVPPVGLLPHGTTYVHPYIHISRGLDYVA